MEELKLPVTWKGKELLFPLEVVTTGYGYYFIVWMDNIRVIFEQDDAGELRAVLPDSMAQEGRLPDTALIALIGTTLQSLR